MTNEKGCGKMCPIQNKIYRCGQKLDYAKFDELVLCSKCKPKKFSTSDIIDMHAGNKPKNNSPIKENLREMKGGKKNNGTKI